MKISTVFSVVAILMILTSATNIIAQSNPTPFDLSGGNYALTDWLSTSAAGTYPPSMVFQQPANIDDSFDAAAVADWNCTYSLTSGARITGLGTNGVGFINTGTANCNCAFAGSALLALSTTNRTQVRVSFVAQTLGAGQRRYGLRLQYRLATTGAWTSVINNVAPVEFVSVANVTGSQVSISSPLPSACDNQPLVQLRWVYYYVANSGTGTRPQIRLDDISVTSNSVVGTPTNLLIESVIPAGPSQNTAFGLVVRSTDALGAAKNVTSATTVQLSLNTGTGTLGGTLTGTIAAGQNSLTFSNVTYNVAEAGVSIRASSTAGMVLTLSNSSAFAVQTPATYSTILGAQQDGYSGVAFNPITVSVFRADNAVDANYFATVSITKVSGPGSVSGVSSITAVQGIALFDNVTVSLPGTYQLQVNIPGLPSQTLPFTTAFSAPSMNTDIVPQFIHSRVASGTCNSSVQAFPIPVFARVTFTGLQPNTTYRYNSGLATDNIITSTGGGFNIHYNGSNNTYVYGGGKSLTTVGEYSTFSTLSTETTKSVWINLVVSTNAAFQEGNVVNWRVSLGDNLGRFVNRYQLSQTSSVLRLGTGANQATGIADDRSQLTEKNFILLYDNTAGTGRPLSVSVIQSIGTLVPGAETFYATRQNMPSSWATFIPNTNVNGVRRIEERDYRTNAIVYSITSLDGRWNSVQTNPSDLASYPSGPGGFANPIILQTPRITITTPKSGDTLCAGQTVTTSFVARGVNNVRIEFSSNNGLSWSVMLDAPAPNGSTQWIVPAIEFAGQSRIRVTGIERTDISATSSMFAVASKVTMVNRPESKNLCVGDAHSLLALTSGAVRMYQWYKNSDPIPGANAPLYQITRAQYGTSGFYYCVISGFGQCGSTISDSAHIRVGRPTSIVQQTRNAPVQLGKSVVLTVEAEVPDEALSYQWYRGLLALKDDGRILGANSSRLEIKNVGLGDLSNDYSCVVVGICGVTRSKNVRVFLNGVYVEFAVKSVAACSGSNVIILGQAYVNPQGAPLLRQWMRNGQPLFEGAQYSGTTTDTLTIKNVTGQQAGEYVLRAELADNPVISDEAAISVVIATAPAIVVQPQSIDLCEGAPLVLTSSASGQGTLTYQWTKDGAILPGESNPILAIAVMTPARAGVYRVTARTPCGSAQSNDAAIGVKAATIITQQPSAAIDVQVGQPLDISVAATGAGTVQYQWFKDGSQIAGEVAPTFAKDSAELADSGKYWCRVRSECGDATSDTTLVTTRPSTTSINNDGVAGGAVVGRVSPNPVLGFSTLDVSLPTSTRVSITIIDPTGSVVAIIIDGTQGAGSHRYIIDSSSLASGMYQVVTLVNNVPLMQTVIVVK